MSKIGDELNKEMENFIPSLIVTPDEIDKYLGNTKHLYRYSLRNIILAKKQFYARYGKMPEGIFIPFGRATKIGRKIKRGSKASKMIRPRIKKGFRKNKETGEKEEYQYIGGWDHFNVFDITQTEGEPLENTEGLMEGNSSKSSSELIKIIQEHLPIEVTNYLKTHGSTNGTRITFSDQFSENEIISTLIHEWAHNKLGHLDKDKDDNNPLSVKELEAEATAYLITRMLGIENKKARLYICGWNGYDAREAMKEHAKKVIKVAEAIFKEIMEE